MYWFCTLCYIGAHSVDIMLTVHCSSTAHVRYTDVCFRLSSFSKHPDSSTVSVPILKYKCILPNPIYYSGDEVYGIF